MVLVDHSHQRLAGQKAVAVMVVALDLIQMQEMLVLMDKQDLQVAQTLEVAAEPHLDIVTEAPEPVATEVLAVPVSLLLSILQNHRIKFLKHQVHGLHQQV
jgi:hypothetical protein